MRNKQLGIIVSEQEQAQLKQAAGKAGMTLSKWARTVMLEASQK